MIQRSSYRSQRRRRRAAHAAAQRADAHEAVGMARVPRTRRRIHLRCGAVCLKDASPNMTSAIWAEAHEKCWLA